MEDIVLGKQGSSLPLSYMTRFNPDEEGLYHFAILARSNDILSAKSNTVPVKYGGWSSDYIQKACEC